MTLDLSYINEVPSEAQEDAVKRAIEQECFKAIYAYLDNLAELMETKNIETLNVPTIRAMSEEMKQRAQEQNGETQSEN